MGLIILINILNQKNEMKNKLNLLKENKKFLMVLKAKYSLQKIYKKKRN